MAKVHGWGSCECRFESCRPDSFGGVWLNWLERVVRDDEIAGSSPVTPKKRVVFIKNMDLKIILFIFLAITPFYAAILISLFFTPVPKNIFNYSISALAVINKKTGNIFNAATILYSIISIFVPLFIIYKYQRIYLIILSLVYICSSLCLMLVGFFSLEKNKKIHLVFARLFFLFLFFTLLGFTPIFLFIPNSNVLAVFSMISALFNITLIIKSKNGKFSPFWEWCSVVGTILWNTILVTTFLVG